MKPYWFKLIERDEPMPIKPKNHRFLSLLIGVLIGVVGSYFLIPSKVANAPVDQISIVEPVQEPIANPQPIIKNPILNPSEDEDEEDDD
jgi:hypothetical protein